MRAERKFLIDMYDKQTFKGSPTVWTPEKDFYTFIKKHTTTPNIWDY